MSASGRKRDGRAGDPVAGQLRALLQLVLGRPARVLLRPVVAVAADLHEQALGQRVDDRHADAVQAAGDLVAAAVAELAAGVQHGEHDLDRRAALLLVHRDGDPAAVVDDGDRVVGVDRDGDLGAVAGERLVDGVVDDLVDEMVQAHHAGRADVHAGALADGLEAFQHRDVLGVVAGGAVCHRRIVDAALGGASAVRVIAACGQLSLDDVRTPRNPGSEDRGPGREKCLQNNSTTGSRIRAPGAVKIPANWHKIASLGGACRISTRRDAATACFDPRKACAPHPAAQLAERAQPVRQRSSRIACLAERRVEARDQLAGHQIELLRPHRGGAGHRENAVALGRRASGGGDRGPGGALPDLLHAGERRGRRERGRERVQGAVREGASGAILMPPAPPGGSRPERRAAA